jgi:apolipoprotein D and lipocalin family protein
MKTILIVFVMFSLASCSSSQRPLKTVPYVDLSRFMGDWYVIANIPTFIEKDAYNALETYQWNEKEQRIDVLFKFNKGDFNGEQKVYTQKAFIFDSKTNAEWRIQFFWPFKFPYLIIDLAPDYSYTVIGVPNRSYVWIMARTPQLNENLYLQILARLREQGYETSLIQSVPQQKP